MNGHQQDGSRAAQGEPTSQPEWSPSSWRIKPIKQQVDYEDPPAVDKARSKLRQLPPIVTPTEIWKLRRALADVAQGKAFLLQGGDCAELFDYCNADAIDAKIKLLLQMSLVLIWGGNKPVVRIARMAGQYAKPRSSSMETTDDGRQVPSFRGDILNGYPLDQRDIDPDRLVQAYFHSAATLNYVRAQLASGIADLHKPMEWHLGHIGDPALQRKYSAIVDSISESLRFMRTVGADTAGQLETVDLFTSHEGLLLEYEEALTRRLRHPSNRTAPPPRPAYTPKVSPLTGGALIDPSIKSNQSTTGYYNTSTHFLWVGDRTRQPDHAHIEYLRGIENPIGIKVGPTTTAADLTGLLDLVNPDKAIGKVTLITRYGESRIDDLLPAHIAAVLATNHAQTVIWQCDPMHGNTRSTESGIKTRSFAAIFSELASAIRIHKAHGTFLGGVHLELTGDAVTECTGGSQGLQDADLSLRYETFCDPRLNEKQALELAFLVAGSQRGDAV